MLYDTLVEMTAKGLPNSGVRQAGRHTPYAQVIDRAGRIATGLIDRGIERGTPVGLLMVNGPDLLTLAFAVFAAGGVVVPLNAHAPRPELAATARKAHVAAVIASEPYAATGANLIEDLGGTGRFPLFVSGADDATSVAALERYSIGNLPKLGPDDPALYMFSSGSTGIPKVVPHTHGELDIDARNSRERGLNLPDDIQINMMPGSHAMGFLSAMSLAIANATTLYWSDPQPFALSKGRFARAIQDNKVTLLMGVPFMFDALSALKDDIDFGHIRVAMSGAIALSGQTYHRFKERFGVKITQGYGSTECLAIAINTGENIDQTFESVGPPVQGIELTIEPAENPFGPEYGEVVVSAPWVTKGYLDAAETNASTIRNGKFYTGDLGGLGPDGCLYIKGRLKLLIEVAGHKVDPFEIEEVLGTHPAVAEAVVVGIPDVRNGGQRLKAVIVKSAEESPDALIRYCRERLANFKVPQEVEFRDEIPKSAAGKVLRGKLMEAV